ncbi:MAG: MFS transporter [Rhizobiales bacterium]|nr:MFS transporter [Hyphomicrobiales bacterium]
MQKTQAQTKNNFSTLPKIVFLFGLFMNAVGHSYLIISFPNLAREMGFSDSHGGMILGLGALGFLLAAPIWGFISEKIGRRPVLVIGLLAASIVPFIYGQLFSMRLEDSLSLSLAFSLIIFIRVLQALSTGGILPSAQAFIADQTTDKKRINGMGLLAAAFGLGTIAGSSLLWAISSLSIILGFYIIASFTGITTLLNMLLVKDAALSTKQNFKQESTIPWSKIWPCFLITTLGVTCYTLLNHVTGLHLQDLFKLEAEQASKEAGKLLTFTAITMILMQAIILQKVKFPPVRFMQIGALLALFGFFSLSYFKDYQLIIISMISLGGALGLVLPANLALLSLNSNGKVQGKVAGINAMGQGFGFALGPIMGGNLYQINTSYPYLLSALIALVIFSLSFKFQMREETDHQSAKTQQT